ncbi:restriction endonuclease subunit S, partial [Huaxiibacter chinensis]
MVPKLRFRNFTQDWHENSLGDLVDIKSGNSPSNYELSSVGEYPFIKVEDMNNCSKY